MLASRHRVIVGSHPESRTIVKFQNVTLWAKRRRSVTCAEQRANPFRLYCLAFPFAFSVQYAHIVWFRKSRSGHLLFCSTEKLEHCRRTGAVSCAKAIITGNPPVPTPLCCDVLWPAEMYGWLIVTKGCNPFRATNATASAFDKLLLCGPPHLFIFKQAQS